MALREVKSLKKLSHANVIKLKEVNEYTARSAEVEPPGLGSKCGKRVERLCDF